MNFCSSKTQESEKTGYVFNKGTAFRTNPKLLKIKKEESKTTIRHYITFTKTAEVKRQ